MARSNAKDSKKQDAKGKEKLKKVSHLSKVKLKKRPPSGNGRHTKTPAVVADTGKLSSRKPHLQQKYHRDGRKNELQRECKVIWEKLRQRKNVPKRTVAQEEIMLLAQGQFKVLALKHDTARVVQSSLKFGSKEQRSMIFSELKDSAVDLSKLRYSMFVMKALIKYCSPKERNHLICSLYGHVRKLVRHKVASEVVECIYNEFANSSQRQALVQEFYGSEFAIFKDTSIGEAQGLDAVLKTHAEKANKILSHMRDSIMPLLNKEVIRHSIVHKVLLDYINHCSPEARVEIVECLRDHLVHVLHTRDGSRLALACIWHGTAKDRKIVVKSLKGVVGKVCLEKNGHLVLLALFAYMDDTVLIKKVILTELVRELEEVCQSLYGRRVILYLLAPQCPRHFSPQFLRLLTPAAGGDNPHSKKPADVRGQELLEGVAPAILPLAISHVIEWVQSKTHAPLLLEVMLSLPGDLLTLYTPLVEALCGEEGVALMNDSHAHWLLTQLMAAEKGTQGFITQLIRSVRKQRLREWVKGSYRAAYLMCGVLSTEGVGVKIRKKICAALEPLLSELSENQCNAHQTLHQLLTNAV